MPLISEQLKDKRILIWGYGREGKATEQYIKNHVHPKSLEVFEGRKNEIDEDKYDVIIKSPGIVMPEDDPKVTGETELFLSQFRGQTVGITGTKGKSTTSALLYTVLKKCGKDAVLVGNIGKPSFDEIENMKEDTIAVYEMSCHQLWHSHLSPHVAVFLDLYEEHLDYYRTLENYFHAKAHIAQFQEPGDIYYRGYNVPDIPVREGVKVVCVPEKPEIRFDLSIPGEYNQYNASIVYRIAADVFGLDPQSVREAMKGFRGLPHRMQKIGAAGGLTFVDDSISTIPAAAISAAESIPGEKTMLIGGMDRGIDYSELVDFIRKHQEIRFILAYASGKRIYKETGSLANVRLVKDLPEQTKEAVRITPPGGTVILSPASPSYGYFRNFEERGDAFFSLVLGGS